MFPGPSISPHRIDYMFLKTSLLTQSHRWRGRTQPTPCQSDSSYIVTNSSTYHIAVALTPHADAADCKQGFGFNSAKLDNVGQVMIHPIN